MCFKSSSPPPACPAHAGQPVAALSNTPLKSLAHVPYRKTFSDIKEMKGVIMRHLPFNSNYPPRSAQDTDRAKDPRELYNQVAGNKAQYILQYQYMYRTTREDAILSFDDMAAMDTDGEFGISDPEYKQGLTDKKTRAQLRRDTLLEQYVSPKQTRSFEKKSQVEKLEYIKSRIPHTPEQEAEVNIQAEQILAELNRYDAEIEYYDREIGKLGDSEVVAINKDVARFLKSYLNEDQIIEFGKLPKSERREYLKTHTSHAQGTPEQEIENFVNDLLIQIVKLEVDVKKLFKEESKESKIDKNRTSISYKI